MAFPAASICYMPLKGLKAIKPDIVVLKVPKMDLSFSGDTAFRTKWTFIEENLPADIRDKGYHDLKIEKEDVARWHRTLYEEGVMPAWPKEHGGCEWMPFAFTY